MYKFSKQSLEHGHSVYSTALRKILAIIATVYIFHHRQCSVNIRVLIKLIKFEYINVECLW